MRHSFIFSPDFVLVTFILLIMVLIPLILVRFECGRWIFSI